jgi:pilus assembly protein CpaE
MRTSIIAWDMSLMEMLSKNLLAEGYEVVQKEIRNKNDGISSLLDQVIGDVLVVDCSGLQQNDDLVNLEYFTSHQSGTSVVMISTEKNTDVLIAAMQSGISEVLLSPVVEGDLLIALRRLAQRKKNISVKKKPRAKIAAFLSCKGGSGSTFLATNFASVLAEKMGMKTILLDLDLNYGDAAYFVAPGPGNSDITEITKHIERLDEKLLASSVLNVGKNYDLLSAPEEPSVSYAMSPAQLGRLIEIASLNYDIVILDLDRSINPLTRQALDMADVVYLIMENLLPYLRNAKRLVKKCRELGYEDSKFSLIINRYEKNDIIDIEQIEKVVGLKVNYTIHSNFQEVAQAINTGTSLLRAHPNSVIVEVLEKIAHAFKPGTLEKRSNWIGRWIGK